VFRESFRHWTRRYHGSGALMEPFEDADPRSSWEHCPARFCPQIFEGRIWKCAPLAYLQMQNSKYTLPDTWYPYLQYHPLSADCTNDELNEFFDRQDEPYCGMCPARPERFDLPIPSSAIARLPEQADPTADAVRQSCGEIDAAMA
jgi:hypothetical protein